MQIDLTNAKKIAWVFHRTTGVELEELFGEACLAYAKALSCYKPGKSTLDTWTYACMRNQLINFCKKQRIKPISLPSNIAAPKVKESLHMAQLSNDAQTIYQMIVDSPADFYNLPPNLAKEEIRCRLRGLNWQWERILDTFREIKGGV